MMPTRRMLRRVFALCLAFGALPPLAQAEGAAEQRELYGQVGNRSALIVLNSSQEKDGTWRVTGEYLILSTLVRRFVEGERSPQLGVTTLREGPTPIFFGRAPTATLRGTWRNGVLQGSRLGPGGQERERFEFSETFPAPDTYGAQLRCEPGDDRYSSVLAYTIEKGRLRPGSFEWRSRVMPGGHSCSIGPEDRIEQRAAQGALQWIVSSAGHPGNCAVTLRDLGDYVRVAAADCGAYCGTQSYFEPVLVDKRGSCRLLRPQAR